MMVVVMMMVIMMMVCQRGSLGLWEAKQASNTAILFEFSSDRFEKVLQIDFLLSL